MNQSTVRVTQLATNYFVRSVKLVSVTAVPLVLASIGSKPIKAQSINEFGGASQIAFEKEKVVNRLSSSASDCDDSFVERDGQNRQHERSCDRILDSKNSAQYSLKTDEPSQLAVRSTVPTYIYTAPKTNNLSDTATTQSSQSFSQTEEEFIQQMTRSDTTAFASRQSHASLLITPPIQQSAKSEEVASVSYTPLSSNYPTAANNSFSSPPQPLPYAPTNVSPQPATPTPAAGYPQSPVAQSLPTPNNNYPTPATNPYGATVPNQHGYNAAPNPLAPLPYVPINASPQPATPTPAADYPQSPPPNKQSTITRRSLPSPSTNLQSSDLLDRGSAIGSPILQLQGASVFDSDDTSARGRVTAAYPVSSNVFIGGSLDLTEGNAFADSRAEGLQLNEMYLAASLESLPNLRFSVGQLDLTSYFDRNSFAKDGATHFFNPTFQSNPALSVSGLGSRLGALVNWSVTDNLEAKAATFSSARGLSDFQLDAFAGEVGLRYGNAIIRGTYATGTDAGSGDGFEEVFLIGRDDNSFGVDSSDQEESYGINAEVFIPNLQLGLFGRYGWYNNLDLNEEAETYSFGFNFLDLITPADRLGVAYGRRLSNDRLRSEADNDSPDVLEAFYDFRFLPQLRLGLSIQAVDGFSDALLGVRVKTEFDGFTF